MGLWDLALGPGAIFTNAEQFLENIERKQQATSFGLLVDMILGLDVYVYIDRFSDREILRWIERQTGRQTDRQTDR